MRQREPDLCSAQDCMQPSLQRRSVSLPGDVTDLYVGVTEGNISLPGGFT